MACSSTICAQAVEQWIARYDQRCWLRQLTPYATREQEDELLRVIARMDGTAVPDHRAADRPVVARPAADRQRLDARNSVRGQ